MSGVELGGRGRLVELYIWGFSKYHAGYCNLSMVDLLNFMRRRISHLRCQSVDGSPVHSANISESWFFGGSDIV